MKKVAFWISVCRFNRLFDNFIENDVFEPIFLVRKHTQMKNNKNVFYVNPKDHKAVIDILKKNNIDTVFMSHPDDKFTKLFKGKKYFLPHGFYDCSPEIKKVNEFAGSYFDKIIVPGDLSKETMIKYFGYKEKDIITNIFLPFDSIYNEKSKQNKKTITLIDHGIAGPISIYNSRFFVAIRILSDFCNKNNLDFRLKLKNINSLDTLNNDIYVKNLIKLKKINMYDVEDWKYIFSTKMLFVTRSPSVEVESACLRIPLVVLRGKNEDYNGMIKCGAALDMDEKKISPNCVQDIIQNYKESSEKQEKFLVNNNIIFDNKNFERLVEFIKAEA